MMVHNNYHGGPAQRWAGGGFQCVSLPPQNVVFPYLVNAPLISSAAAEIEHNIQAPKPMIYSCIFGAISLVQQGLIDVRLPIGQVVPTSQMYLTIGDSGERKTAVESSVLAEIYRFQKRQKYEFTQNLRAWKVEHDLWRAERKAIIKSAVNKGAGEALSDLSRQQLLEHENSEPKKPREFKIIYDDSTSEALFYGLYQNLPAAGLISSEGGGVLAGRAFNDLAKQNAIWSGDTITVDRATRESFDLVDRRLTVMLMVQNSAFEAYMDRRGEATRGSGLWARFLVSRPESTQGNRFVRNGSPAAEKQELFNSRMNELLNQVVGLLEAPESEKQVLHFSPDASNLWTDIANEIEVQIRPGGRFENAGDHASKLPNNIARLAASIHWFEGYEGDISKEVLNMAIDIGFWYSDEYLGIFLPPPRHIVDAQELRNWLDSVRMGNQRYIRKNHIRQYGPGRIRNKVRLNDALDILKMEGQVSIFTAQNVTCVDLFPGDPYNAAAAQVAIFGQVIYQN
ncbi:YfjI family protein [Marinobacter sp.]|uniref:YfjI family protein n=1 Tax=Marinobacter sp. TaxID=50741 RepID=UPI003A8F7B5E